MMASGYENPFAIQMYHNRHRAEYSEKPIELLFLIKSKDLSSVIGTIFYILDIKYFSY